MTGFRAGTKNQNIWRIPYGFILVAALVLLSYVLSPDPCYACGTPGKDGPATISGVVNTYYPGASVSGTSITLGASRGSTISITPGDVVLIIQMEDASINSSNTDAYGNGVGGDIHPQTTPVPPIIPGPNTASGSTSLNSAGLYEFNIATSAVASSGGTLTLANPLINTYENAAASASAGQKRFQVVRVPQYSSVTLSGKVTAAPWDGNTGGIVAFDVAGNLNFNGQAIDVSLQGFRGGYALANSYENPTLFQYTDENANSGYKGEGIAGTPALMWDGIGKKTDSGGYPGGNRGMGAPGNAGGGGSYDSAGGGGAHYGAGGRGGDEYCPANPPKKKGKLPSICGFIPDRSSPDHKPGPLGGMGGLVANGALSKTRMIMGGGGGGGGDHNSSSSIRKGGGRGGGIVLVRTGTSSGTGMINAGGENAQTGSLSGNGSGGGAGGTVYIVSGSLLSGVTIIVNGGSGGSVTGHAPGGGGGGGVIYQSGGASVNLSGGLAGKRSINNPTGSLNAMPGGAGISDTASPDDLLPGIPSGAACLPILTVNKITTTPVRAVTDTTASYTIMVSNASGKGTTLGVNIVDDLPNPFTYGGTSATVTYTGGATGPVSPMTGSGADPVIFGTAGGSPSFTLPGGGSVEVTFLVNINGGNGTFQNPASTFFLDPTRTAPGQTVTPGGVYSNGTTVGGVNYDSSSSTQEDVLVGNVSLTLTKSAVTISDPVNGITNPKAISGAFVDYLLILKNPNPFDIDSGTIFLIDTIPSEAALFVGDIGGGGSGPVIFTDGSPASGLTYNFSSLGSTADDISFSNDGGGIFNYTPNPDAFQVDLAVTHIRINPKGVFKGNTEAKFRFRVRIK